MAKNDGFFTLLATTDLLMDLKPTLFTLSAGMAEETIGLVKDGYRNETDPYGKKWKVKKRKDGRMVLSGKTGDLKTKWKRTQVDADGHTVTAGVDYADHHQRPRRRGKKGKGKLKRPQRLQVPTESRGLPAAWSAQYNEAAEEMLEAAFDGVTSGKGGKGSRARRLSKQFKIG